MVKQWACRGVQAERSAQRQQTKPNLVQPGGSPGRLRNRKGRDNFGFTVSKADIKCTSSCAYKGQLVLINNSKWRLNGTLNNHVKTSTGKAASSSSANLF